MKKVLKILLWVILVLVVLAGALFAWLTVTEYRPADVEALAVGSQTGQKSIKPGEELTLLSWNIGYGGLGKESDFFMDGGKDARSADKAKVGEYLAGISKTITDNKPDLVMLQEVDIDSSRTYRIDERPLVSAGMDNLMFAYNYSCPFVPVPIPPIGRVNSGLFTMTAGLKVERAERIALPCPFSWPMRIANLKRCLLVSYLPVEGSGKQLVLINLHLEAYDDGEGKVAQTNQLKEFMQSEYGKGNYVIAGGDFNQVFPGSLALYPNTHEENWAVGVLDENLLPDGWMTVCDLSVPTCRLLNQPYDPSDKEGTQYYVIDGFILSPNVSMITAKTLDEGFANSDHNPVKLVFELK